MPLLHSSDDSEHSSTSCSQSRPETVQISTFTYMTATEKPKKFWEAHITHTMKDSTSS